MKYAHQYLPDEVVVISSQMYYVRMQTFQVLKQGTILEAE